MHRLVAFLYLLLRDELTSGQVERLMLDAVKGGDGATYSNAAIEAYARQLVTRLVDLPPPAPDYAAGIRAHRDTPGDDRCYRDDAALYSLLPEGYRPRAVACRRNPETTYVSPQRRIDQLEGDLIAVLAGLELESRRAHSWGCVTLPSMTCLPWEGCQSKRCAFVRGLLSQKVLP